jgi:hypothetical protein
MTAANALMNLFQTNWVWTNMNNSLKDSATIYTKTVTYNTCDCGLSAECVQSASMINNQSIPGLLTGCYPIEAFLQSTLECMYNGSCIRQLHSTNMSFTPLNDLPSSRYRKNSTIADIISQLMTEQWSSNVTYEDYFTKCAPLYCSYSYIEYRSSVDVITTVLGVYGGLVIITKIIVLIMINIYHVIKPCFC